MGSGRRERVTDRLGVLGERNFRLFFAGYTTSLVGAAMVPVALTFAVLNQGGGATDVSYVLAAETVPLVALLLIAVRLRPRRPLVTATIGGATFALPVALIALPADTLLVAGAAGIAGIGLSIFGTLWETTLQREVRGEALSRVSSYDWFGSTAFVPIGYLLAGPLASILGVRTTLLLAAFWAAASCAAVLTSRSVRSLTARPADPPGAADPAMASSTAP
jgi:MFS family permease